MSDYLMSHGTRATPQAERARPDQIANEAGGYVFAVDPFARLRRFLILGSEGGSYYASERKLTGQNVDTLRACVQADGPATVQEIVQVSESGAAPSNDPALYALAAAISLGDRQTKSLAAEALPQVARIGTHLYHFVAYAETMRGWGRTLRWAVSNWYQQRPEFLAYQAVKYRQRDAWSHRDLLRLSHPKAVAELAPLLDWITHAETWREENRAWVVPPDALADVDGEEDPFRIVRGFELALQAKSAAASAALIREYGLPREAVQSEHLTDPDVWRALLDAKMPLGAMVRNLGNMTRLGVLQGAYASLVADSIADEDNVRRSRLHPMALLLALRTYASGHGLRGGNAWNPIPNVIDALDEAFYLAFDNVAATGKRILLGVDVSGSMSHEGVAGAPLSAREAAVAMALVTLHAEPNVEIVGFTDKIYTGLGYSRRQRLDDAVANTPRTGEGTDCSLPIRYADQGSNEIRAFDSIVLYTDNQTWAGPTHVHQAIGEYRNRAGLPTRLVACGLVANEFTVCDPEDPLSLNVVGFDTSAPRLISDFAAGAF